jgi:hypothetical protein
MSGKDNIVEEKAEVNDGLFDILTKKDIDFSAADQMSLGIYSEEDVRLTAKEAANYIGERGRLLDAQQIRKWAKNR